MPDNMHRLSAKEAEQKVREIYKYRYFTPSSHFTERMRKRGYDIQDIEEILSKGRVSDPPELSEEYNNWVCKVEGRSIEGDMARVVTAIIDDNELFCITIEYIG